MGLSAPPRPVRAASSPMTVGEVVALERRELLRLAENLTERLSALPSCSEWHWTLRQLRVEILLGASV